MAKRYHVPGYGSMTHDELVEAFGQKYAEEWIRASDSDQEDEEKKLARRAEAAQRRRAENLALIEARTRAEEERAEVRAREANLKAEAAEREERAKLDRKRGEIELDFEKRRRSEEAAEEKRRRKEAEDRAKQLRKGVGRAAKSTSVLGAGETRVLDLGVGAGLGAAGAVWSATRPTDGQQIAWGTGLLIFGGLAALEAKGNLLRTLGWTTLGGQAGFLALKAFQLTKN